MRIVVIDSPGPPAQPVRPRISGMKFPHLIYSLTALALAPLAACSRAGKSDRARTEESIPVTVIEARRIPWERKISLVGTLLPNQEARIAAEVEGSIEKTLVEVGESVPLSQALAQIDTASYQGQVSLFTANLAKAQANADNQNGNLERLQKLRQTGAVSSNTYEEAVAAQKQAEASVAAAKAQLGSAETALSRSLAKAPFSGAITERLVNAGDFVRVGTVMFHLVDDSVLKFRGEIPEREVVQIRVGQKVRLHVDAYPGRGFEGIVSWINPAVDTATRAVGIEARVENREHLLKANFFARAELVVDAAAPTLVVPVDSIVSFAGVNKVFVVEKGAAEPREVELGGTHGEEQEITRGLKGGEKVIVNGRTKVQPGVRVTVVPGVVSQPEKKP